MKKLQNHLRLIMKKSIMKIDIEEEIQVLEQKEKKFSYF